MILNAVSVHLAALVLPKFCFQLTKDMAVSCTLAVLLSASILVGEGLAATLKQTTQETGDGRTPLYLALEANKTSDAIRLVQAGENPDRQVSVNGCLTTLLHLAVARDQAYVATPLLAFGADPNIVDCHNLTAINCAILSGNTKVIKDIVAAGYDLNWQPSSALGPIFFAIRHNKTLAINTLVELGANVNVRNMEGNTPVLEAVKDGLLEITVKLLDYGAYPNVVGVEGKTPLSIATNNNSSALVSALLKHGAHADMASKNGTTPLYEAVTKGLFNVAESLLEGGANLSYRFPDGKSYLHKTAESGDLGSLGFFLAHGTYPDIVDNHNQTTLYYAVMNNSLELTNILLFYHANTRRISGTDTYLTLAVKHNSTVALAALLEHGVNVNVEDASGEGPALHAVKNGEAECLRLLLEAGANASYISSTDYNRTLLHWAAMGNSTDIVEMLLNARADIEAIGTAGSPLNYTGRPLHYAALFGTTHIVDLLIKRGAEVNSADGHGHSPLYVAKQRGDVNAARLIQNSGGKYF